LKNFQFRLKIDLAPKENMVGKLPTAIADQAFDKRMAPRAIGHRFDLLNVLIILKVRLPKPVFE